MKNKKSVGFAVCLLAGLAVAVPAHASVQSKESAFTREILQQEESFQGYEEGEAVILYKAQPSVRFGEDAVDSLGADISVVETYDFRGTDRAGLPDVKSGNREKITGDFCVSLVKSERYSAKELVERMKQRPDILVAEPNYRTHCLNEGSDPYQSYQWALDNQGQNGGTPGCDIKPDQDVFGNSQNEKECVIALLDTGMDAMHEDLKGVVWENPVRSSRLRGRHGYDFVNLDDDPTDDNGHGSHCSGIMAAAADNGFGVRGVAGGAKVKIMALKTLDANGMGSDIHAIAAYHYIYQAQQLGVNVVAVNNSWEGMEAEQSEILAQLIDLVGKNGAVSVCAAGNSASDNDRLLSYPSCIDSEYVVSVAATNEKDELAAFSNYGADSVDLAAPGTDILSTVSYDCFNPGIYEDAGELCSLFETFSKGELVQGSETQTGKIAYGFCGTDDVSHMSAELSGESYFGTQGESQKSLKWRIPSAKEDKIYTIYFPYTAPKSATGLYGSLMVKAVGGKPVQTELGSVTSCIAVNDVPLENDGTVKLTADSLDLLAQSIGAIDADGGNYWHHVSGQTLTNVETEERRAVAVSLIALVDGDYEIYLDDLGISRENITSERFGKYDYYNGTSMAAPYVTGAAAVFANAFPAENASDRAAHLIGCTRASASLGGKTAEGGVLDLSLVESPNARLRDIVVDDQRNVCIVGKYLKGAAVTVNGKGVTPKEQSDNKIVLSSDGLWNRPLDFVVRVKNRVFSEYRFFADGKKFAFSGNAVANLHHAFAVSDGEQICLVNRSGYVMACNPREVDELGNVFWMEGEFGYTAETFGINSGMVADPEISNLSDIVYLDGRLWTALKLELGYAQQSVLACYDQESGWAKACDLPEGFENKEGISIAVYQGMLYLMGGYDKEQRNVTSQVVRMDPQRRLWEPAPQLPQARAFAKAVQTKDQLVVMYGRGADASMPKAFLFDGKSWSVSAAELPSVRMTGSCTYLDGDMQTAELTYYDGRISPVKDGVVCTGLQAGYLGDTYVYQPSSDRFVPSGYSVGQTAAGCKAMLTAGIQDKFYLISQDGGGDAWTASEVFLYEMPVQSPCVEVTAPETEGGFVDGGYLDGIRHYMPGDVITVVANAEDGYFVKSFEVNGRKIAKSADGSYCYRAAANPLAGTIKASLQTGAYVWEIMMEESVEIAAGKSYQLVAGIAPENADNQKIIWSSSNPKVVSVNQKGKVAVSEKAKKNTTAVITATAADRKTVAASCLVTVTARELPAKNTKHNVGGLKYKVTKSSAKTKTAACIGFAKKSAKSVKIPASVKIDGYQYKVTEVAQSAFSKDKKIKSAEIGKHVTSIGKNAFCGCQKLRSVTIKTVSLKSVGKGAFSDIDKKAAVRVPKKQKKRYASLLKQSGFRGKIG